MLINLLTHQSENGSGPAVVGGGGEHEAFANPALYISVHAYGNWEGAKVILEGSNDPSGEEWAPLQYLSNGAMTDLELVDNFILNTNLVPGSGLRATVADAGEGTDITVTALGLINSVL